MITFTPSLAQRIWDRLVMGQLGFIFNCRGDYYRLERGEAMRFSREAPSST